LNDRRGLYLLDGQPAPVGRAESDSRRIRCWLSTFRWAQFVATAVEWDFGEGEDDGQLALVVHLMAGCLHRDFDRITRANHGVDPLGEEHGTLGRLHARFIGMTTVVQPDAKI
jgi:hypothetical protein